MFACEVVTLNNNNCCALISADAWLSVPAYVYLWRVEPALVGPQFRFPGRAVPGYVMRCLYVCANLNLVAIFVPLHAFVLHDTPANQARLYSRFVNVKFYRNRKRTHFSKEQLTAKSAA